MTKPSVLWIGPHARTLHRELVARLEANGLSVLGLDIEFAGALFEMLRLHPKAVIVFCEQGTEGTTRRVLASLEAGLRSSPVVALVERPELGDYFDVMNQGDAYYEQDESPKRAAQAVWWAANTRAA